MNNSKNIPVKPLEEYTVRINYIGAKGDGVTSINKFIIIVKEAVQDRVYKIRINRVMDTYAFAEIIEEVEVNN